MFFQWEQIENHFHYALKDSERDAFTIKKHQKDSTTRRWEEDCAGAEYKISFSNEIYHYTLYTLWNWLKKVLILHLILAWLSTLLTQHETSKFDDVLTSTIEIKLVCSQLSSFFSLFFPSPLSVWFLLDCYCCWKWKGGGRKKSKKFKVTPCSVCYNKAIE
jgi:hypothetical protein